MIETLSIPFTVPAINMQTNNPTDHSKISILDDQLLHRAVKKLTQQHQYFKKVVDAHGMPPLWEREQSFATLVHIILEQQVSLRSARVAFDRLKTSANRLQPKTFLELDDAKLKQIGFSRQKTRYCRELAKAMLEERLDLESLRSANDQEVQRRLCAIKGIGPWTANIYLLMALRRPDAWPRGDLALELGYQRLHGLPEKPSADELESISETWRPLRAVAARLIYHFYLSAP